MAWAHFGESQHSKGLPPFALVNPQRGLQEVSNSILMRVLQPCTQAALPVLCVPGLPCPLVPAPLLPGNTFFCGALSVAGRQGRAPTAQGVFYCCVL